MIKKAQIWVETAIYTLVGLTIIAILLAVVTPQIEKIKDRSVITQTIDALNELDAKISEAEQSPGNIRVVNFKVGKGQIEIKSDTNSIVYTLEDTRLELSEVGKPVEEAGIVLKTEEYGARFKISLTMDYTERLEFTFEGNEENKVLHAGTTPYKIQIENIEAAVGAKTHIDFGVI